MLVHPSLQIFVATRQNQGNYTLPRQRTLGCNHKQAAHLAPCSAGRSAWSVEPSRDQVWAQSSLASVLTCLPWLPSCCRGRGRSPRGSARLTKLTVCAIHCCCYVAQSCLTLYDPMDWSTPGFPVLNHLPEFPNSYPLSR